MLKQHPTHARSNTSTFWYLCLLLLPLVAFALYWPGLTGGWFFDDEPNLKGLYDVFALGSIDWHAAVDFVFSGIAGPMGRSVALASFLIDGSAWPYTPSAMLYTNIGLHALNAVLVFAVVYQIGNVLGWSLQRSTGSAFFVALIWLVLPIHASTVLVVVQRMVLLSSTFMLLGLWTHLLLRAHLTASPRMSSLLIVMNLGFWTVLGVITKEQAALLPVLVLVLEITLLPQPHLGASGKLFWRGARAIAMLLPTALVLAYLARTVLHADEAYAMRAFDLTQRIWTEGAVLWRYLLISFVPRRSAYAPFHDDFHAYDFGLATTLALALWVLVLFLALLKHRQWPVFAFAVLWFLGAHLIESTVIPLELYFEHRNYLALLGPIIALVFSIASWAYQAKKTVQACAVGISYTLVLGLVLFQTTSLMGNPLLASEIWVIEHPGSSRAVQNLAQKYVVLNDIPLALKIVDEGAKNESQASDLVLQGLQMECSLPKPDPILAEQRFERSMQVLPTGGNNFAIVPTLDKLKSLVDKGSCPEVLTRERLAQLAIASLNNPKVTAFRQNSANLHVFLATLAIDERNLESAIHHLERALNAVADFSTLVLSMSVLNSAGLEQAALDLMKAHPVPLPTNPIMRKRLKQNLAALEKGQRELMNQQNHVRSHDD